MTKSAVPALAEGFLVDVIEYHSDILIHGCEQDSVSHWESLDYFWKLYTGSTTKRGSGAGTGSGGRAHHQEQQQQRRSKYGRINNRKQMAQIIMFACHLDAYKHDAAADNSNDDDNEDSPLGFSPMVEWDRKQWKWLKKRIEALRKSLMRVDAHEPLVDPRNENCATDDRRLNHPLFTKKYDKLVDFLQVNELLSLLRGPIERQLEINSSTNSCNRNNVQEGQLGQEPVIPQADLQAFQ